MTKKHAAEWFAATHELSPAAKGCWADTVAKLDLDGGCSLTRTYAGWGLLWNCSEGDAGRHIEELKEKGIAGVSVAGDGHVALVCHTREKRDKELEAKRLRQRAFRERRAGDGAGDAPDDVGALVQTCMDLWNETAAKHSLSKVTAIHGARRRKLLVRLREPEWFKKLPEALGRIRYSSFLLGKTGRSTWRGANFDWLICDLRVQKLCEKQYDDSQPQAATGRDDGVM